MVEAPDVEVGLGQLLGAGAAGADTGADGAILRAGVAAAAAAVGGGRRGGRRHPLLPLGCGLCLVRILKHKAAHQPQITQSRPEGTRELTKMNERTHTQKH